MPNDLREQFDYDINGRLRGQKISVGAGARDLVRRDYKWDAHGNIVGLDDCLRGARKFAYDPVERLRKVERIISGETNNSQNSSADRIVKSVLPPDKRHLAGGRTRGSRLRTNA